MISVDTKKKADYDNNWYPTGVKVTDKALDAVPLEPHEFYGEWNYSRAKHQRWRLPGSTTGGTGGCWVPLRDWAPRPW